MAQDTAVVILNWNGKRLMEEFLPSVATLSQGADVIVADNGSTDGSVEWLKENYPLVRVLAFKENHGFAGGYNLAIKRLEGYKYIVLLNSDVEVTENWIAPLKEYMHANPDVAACQPKICLSTQEQPEDFSINTAILFVEAECLIQPKKITGNTTNFPKIYSGQQEPPLW